MTDPSFEQPSPPPRRSPNRTAEVVMLAIALALVLTVVLVGVARLGGDDSGDSTGDSGPAAQESAGGAATPVVAGSYPQWAGYEDEGGYYLADAVDSGAVERLTHLVYAYGAVTEEGECVSADPWADYQWPIPADRSVDGEGDADDQPLAGHLNQLRKLKARYPDLTVTIAVGSDGGSRDDFAAVAATPEGREAFATGCVDTFLRGDLPVEGDEPQGGPGVAEGIFDGIEIHWQWPAEADRDNHAALLAELRRQLDVHGEQVGRRFSLGTMVPAFTPFIEDGYDVPEVFAQVDYATIEGYWFYAPWNGDNLVTNHHAQLYSPAGNPYTQWGYEQSVDGGVQLLTGAGAQASQLVLGMPAFGPGWQGVPETDDGLYQTGTGGEVSYTYDEIEDAPGTTYVDDDAIGAFRYDGDLWYSYDTPETAAVKAGYAREQALGGVAIWPLSGDTDAELLTAVAGELN